MSLTNSDVACGKSELAMYYDIALLRPDCTAWLAPLANAHVIVCDFSSESSCSCHATVLLRLLHARSDKAQSPAMPTESDDVCPDREPEEPHDEIIVAEKNCMHSLRHCVVIPRIPAMGILQVGKVYR